MQRPSQNKGPCLLAAITRCATCRGLAVRLTTRSRTSWAVESSKTRQQPHTAAPLTAAQSRGLF